MPPSMHSPNRNCQTYATTYLQASAIRVRPFFPVTDTSFAGGKENGESRTRLNFNLKTGCAAAAPGRPFPARGRAPRGAPQKRRPRSTNTMTNTNQDGPSMPPDCIRMCAYVIRMQVSTGYIVPKRLHSICTVSRYSQRFFVSPLRASRSEDASPMRSTSLRLDLTPPRRRSRTAPSAAACNLEPANIQQSVRGRLSIPPYTSQPVSTSSRSIHPS